MICANCSQPLPDGAPACPNCGRLVKREAQIPLVFLILGAFVSVIALIFLQFVVFMNAVGAPGPQGGRTWLLLGYTAIVIAVCVAAIIYGVRSAGRGDSRVLPVAVFAAFFVLVPTTTCTATTVFSTGTGLRCL